MNAGKTAAACALISEITHAGYTVDALKATGVSLRRDVLAMEDAGARAPRCSPTSAWSRPPRRTPPR